MKCGLQPQEKLEKMLIVLIGGFLIYILKHECHMDNICKCYLLFLPRHVVLCIQLLLIALCQVLM